MKTNSSNELVDVVNDSGDIIAVVPRHQMRKERLPHRCAYILVFNQSRELFIHLRTAGKDIYPANWDVTIGGVLNSGEAFDTGAHREIQEELGIDVKLDTLFPFRYGDEATVVQGMVYRAVHPGPFRFQAEEIDRGEFVSLKALDSRIASDPFCPDGLAVLAEYRRLLAIDQKE